MADSKEVSPQQLNWWEFCPICGCKLVNHRCKLICSNPKCHYFQSCSEFDT
jgi:hypothetical protein